MRLSNGYLHCLRDREAVGVRTQRVEEKVPCVGNDGARLLQQDGLSPLQPIRTQPSSDIEPALPALGKTGLLNKSYFDLRPHYVQEGEFRRDIVRRRVYADLQQRGRRVLTQIHHWLPGKVPSAAGSQPARAA
jgi:hypothetical protein